MKALVLTAHDPVSAEGETNGALMRFSMFMRALAGVCSEIDLLNFLTPGASER